MTGPLFFVVAAACMIILPAIAGWSLSQKQGLAARMFATLLGGQLILTPAIIFFTFAQDQAADGNPIRTVIVYAMMALMISIMTFVIREMMRAQRQ